MLKYYKEQVHYNDKIDYGIGIITGWQGTYKDEIFNSLDSSNKDKVVSCGHLYSKNGINYIIRNLFLNPHINHLIILSDSSFNRKDMSISCETLLSFITLSIEEFNINFKIDEESKKEFIEYFKNHITVCSFLSLNETIKNIDLNITEWTKVKEFEDLKEKQNTSFPSEKVGFSVKSDTIADAWKKMLFLINTYGVLKKTDYEETDKQKELLNLSVVIRNEDINNKYIPEFLGLSKEEIENYCETFLQSELPLGVRYTYPNRLMEYDSLNSTAINQLEYMENILREKTYSRRSIASLWNPSLDTINNEVPCLDLIQAIIEDNELHLIGYFRSNDIYDAWVRNAFGLLSIQKRLCENLNLKKGYLSTIAGSAHVYERNFLNMQELINKEEISFCEEDARGYFTINIVEKQIVVKLFSKENDLLKTFISKDQFELRRLLSPYISVMQHAIYIGQELQKASICLENDLDYIQDSKLILKKQLDNKK